MVLIVLMFKYSFLFRWLMNLWPPFLLTGIHVTHITKDFRKVTVELRMRAWNKNSVGVHFGGSLFAMTDPFYMLTLSACLGKHYYVWDKRADIDYVKPGRGTVKAHFEITDQLLDDIIVNTSGGEKYLPELMVYVTDEDDELVAKLKRTLYVRKKPQHR